MAGHSSDLGKQCSGSRTEETPGSAIVRRKDKEEKTSIEQSRYYI
jgi:hypothetical protein